MLSEIKDVLSRSQSTLAQDLVGIVALGVIFFGGLHLPGLF